MKFEKITENKIRIVLNMEDLKKNNIDFHSFMSNSEETKDLFYDMLDQAEREIGFITKNYKLSIEAISIPERKFYINYNSYFARNYWIKFF